MPGRFCVPFAVALLHGALQAQTVSFLAHRDFPIARGCCTVVSGDFNGDGKLDLVVAYGGNLALLPGDGTGGFKPKIDFGTFSGGLQKLAASDVNSDGKLDLVVNSGLQVNIFLGNGNGTFQAPFQPVALGYLLFVADLNGDHVPDLGISSLGLSLSNPGLCDGFEAHLGNGDGTFQKPRECINPHEGMGQLAVVGDINGDGKPDFAWSSSRSNGAIHLFLGNGDGTFRAQPELYTCCSGVVTALALGDLNRDGSTDLVIHKEDHVLIWFGKGDGTFPQPFLSLDVARSYDLVVADFDGDGNPDIAVGNIVISGNGDGTFRLPQYFLAGPANSNLAVSGDFNGDGLADLVFVDYPGDGSSATTLSVLLNASRSSPVLALGESAATGVDFLAPASIGTIFGKNLARGEATAAGSALPTQLGGIRLRVRDSADTVRLAPLFYASPSQINFLVPEQTAMRTITLQIDDESTPLAETANATLVGHAAPGIFAANGQGRGVAAATALRVQADGSQQAVPVFDCKGPGQCTALPIELSGDRPVYLSLFGTGFRAVQTLGEGQPPHVSCSVGGLPAVVQFVGAQPTIPGLDQLNLLLPVSAPPGTASVECKFFISRGVGIFSQYPNSNPVQIAIK